MRDTLPGVVLMRDTLPGVVLMRDTLHMWIGVPCATWDVLEGRDVVFPGDCSLLDQSHRRVGGVRLNCTHCWFLISSSISGGCHGGLGVL
jgi:hypothetical protein